MNNNAYLIKSRLARLIRPLAYSIAVLLAFISQSAQAYSSIGNVNGWSVDQLKEMGITIRPWTHDKDTNDRDDMQWVEISYDWKRMGVDRHVELTLYTANNEGKPMAACRAEHRKGQADPVKLIFTVPKESMKNCHVLILFPESIADGKKHDNKRSMIGSPSLRGYSLDLWRIVQLAGEFNE